MPRARVVIEVEEDENGRLISPRMLSPFKAVLELDVDEGGAIRDITVREGTLQRGLLSAMKRAGRGGTLVPAAGA